MRRGKYNLLLLVLLSLAAVPVLATDSKVESVGLGFSFAAYSDCLEKLGYAATLANSLEAGGISLKTSGGRTAYCRGLFPDVTSAQVDSQKDGVSIESSTTSAPTFGVVKPETSASQIALNNSSGITTEGKNQAGVSFNMASAKKEEGVAPTSATPTVPAGLGGAGLALSEPGKTASITGESPEKNVRNSVDFTGLTPISGSGFEMASESAAKRAENPGFETAAGGGGSAIPSFKVTASAESGSPSKSGGGGFVPSSSWNKGEAAMAGAGVENSRAGKFTYISPPSKFDQRKQQELSALERMLLDPGKRVPSAVHQSDRATENVSLFSRVGTLLKAKRQFFRREKQ